MKTTIFLHPKRRMAVSEKYFESLCDKYMNSVYGVVFRAVDKNEHLAENLTGMIFRRVMDAYSGNPHPLIPCFSHVLKITIAVLQERGHVLALANFTLDQVLHIAQPA